MYNFQAKKIIQFTTNECGIQKYLLLQQICPFCLSRRKVIVDTLRIVQTFFNNSRSCKKSIEKTTNVMDGYDNFYFVLPGSKVAICLSQYDKQQVEHNPDQFPLRECGSPSAFLPKILVGNCLCTSRTRRSVTSVVCKPH